MERHFVPLGKILQPNEFTDYIEESEKLNTIVHKYGSEFTIPNYPCWMAYKNEGNIEGSISFTRNTFQHPILKDMVYKIYGILKELFINGLEPKLERIHFIRTIGDIVPHRDEAGRTACINIGIQNSSGAITRLSNDDLFANFTKNNTPYTLSEGHGYFLNTRQIHAVEAVNKNPRYLITYGFGVPFNSILPYLKIKNDTA